MPDIITNILFGFTRQLNSILGNNLSKVIVYGSYARGDYRENSDVDLMVLVKLSDSEIKKILPTIYDMAYDIELENDIHISVVIKNEEQFEYWADTLPFYRNVSEEGIDFKRHKDVVAHFNKNYVATDIFDKKLGRMLANLQQTRETSDYDDFFIASKEDAEIQCKNAESIIEAVKGYLRDKYELESL